MHPYPSLPPATGVPGDHLQGHLWVQEYVAGLPVRASVATSGLITFGDADRQFDAGAEPLPYRETARYVRERLDVDQLRAAVDDAASVTFHGVATARQGFDYDWNRLPPFLGTEIQTAARGLLPADATDRILDRLGLSAVNTFDREVPADHLTPDSYSVPESAWYDGPAAGVVLRDKHGARALVRGATLGEPTPVEAADLVRAVDDARLDRIAADLEYSGRKATVDAVRDRLVAALAREAGDRLDAADVGEQALREAALERVVRWR